MRFHLPHDLPGRIPERPSGPALEPSPFERRRERLAARASEYRGPAVTPVRRGREVPHGRERKARTRNLEQTTVERRSRRNELPNQIIGISLREEERKTLGEIGRFRVIATRDLAEVIYGGRSSLMERDLAFLREKGLIQVDAVNARRDGRGGRVERIEVVTLAKAGRDAARQTSGLPQDQELYSGLVKPHEVEHDAQIYRAYRKEAECIEQKGGRNLRVRLDFELKSQIQKAIYVQRKADPEREMATIKQQVAQQFDLAFVNDGIQIPDARIEYDLPQGGSSEHQDVEVLTAAYRPGHLRAKTQAGFRVYASSSDRATLTARIEDDHDLMRDILEL